MTTLEERQPPPSSSTPDRPATVMLSAPLFVLGCAAVAVAILVAGRTIAMPLGLLGAEVLTTILSLFVLGSFRYQIHKNALTYGMLLIVVATFCGFGPSGWRVCPPVLGEPGSLRRLRSSSRG